MKKLVAAAVLCALSGFSFGQEVSKVTAETLEKALPPDVFAALKNATSVKTLYPINGTETFPDTILKADEIIFSPNAKLVVTSMDSPWIILAANKIKFADVTKWSVISRDLGIKAVNGTVGANGENGANGRGQTDRRGHDGTNGNDGGQGATGSTRKIPDIYLIAGEFTSPDGAPLPGFLRLSLVFPGVDGGSGGKGGNGGNGGRGDSGEMGATSIFDCKEGGGPGGKGGNGGVGGRGGDGGTGGPGANITYVSGQDGIELLSYAKVINVGGSGGQAGDPGQPGNGGSGGSGADRNGFCDSTSNGPDGKRPEPKDLGKGQDGGEGAKGTVTAITVKSLSPVF